MSRDARGSAVSLVARICLSVLLGVIAACGGGGGGGGDASTRPQQPGTSANQLNVTITNASIAADDRPVVRFFLTDSQGAPLPATDVRMRFVIAALQGDGGEYRDYLTAAQTSSITNVTATQAAAEDSAQGTLEDLGGGLFAYAFAATLPASYDRDASHRLAIFADTTILGVAYVSNAIFDFVPSGASVAAVRDIVRTESCNGCHDPLAAHGGSRRDVRLCVTCHSAAITDFATGVTTPQIDPDTGNRIGFPELIHKIHRGESLPSVEAGTPYQIIGRSAADFSHVVFPQDIRNCETCHANGAQSDAFTTRPSREACGSCHDDVNFASGENHGGGPQPTDGSCSGCHLPDSGHEFDLSVVGSHVIPAHSTQAPGVRFEIVGVRSVETGSAVVAPGEHPLVAFRVTTATGAAIAPAAMSSLSLTLGGSTIDYSAQDYDGDGIIVPGDPASPWTPGAETFKSESVIKSRTRTRCVRRLHLRLHERGSTGCDRHVRDRHRGLQVRDDRRRQSEPGRHQLLGYARWERQRSRGSWRGLRRDPRRGPEPGLCVPGDGCGAGGAAAGSDDRRSAPSAMACSRRTSTSTGASATTPRTAPSATTRPMTP